MSLPSIADNFKINKEWIPKKVNHPCYLYDFKKMGVTRKQFAKVISGKEAILFEKPLVEKVRAIKCPWCDFNERENKKKKHLTKKAKAVYRGYSLRDHLYTHNKTIVDMQARKFQEELYTLRLALVREGYHEALSFFVDYECQICLNPQREDRPNMCSIPESPRNRLRSLKLLGYPVEELYALRKEKWSILGVIVLLKS